MDSYKVYVNVTAEFTKDGRLLPKSFVWKDDHVYEIHTCIVDGKESHLYYEDNNMWFMEAR